MSYIYYKTKPWSKRIKDLLIKITLYQLKKYPKDKLERELTKFLKDAEIQICKATRRNGGICYKELLTELTPSEAEKELKQQIHNFKLSGKSEQKIADLLELSLLFKNLNNMNLTDKILLFDEVIHAEHIYGSIFETDIQKIKEEADLELTKLIRR